MKLEYVVNADDGTEYFQVWLTDAYGNSAMLAESKKPDKALWRSAAAKLRKMTDICAVQAPRL